MTGFLKSYSISEKKKRQKLISKTVNSFFELIGKIDNIEDKKAWEKELKEYITARAEILLEIKDENLRHQMLDGMMESTDKFIESANEFDSEVKPTDITQAIRNVWIMNLIQLYAGKKVEFVPSIFAYSMLYPYTDNFLDDPKVSDDKKREFNKRLTQRLEGVKLSPKSAHEETVYSLIEIIEKQYPRENFGHVFDSILSIQKAQIKSLTQQDGVNTKKESALVPISIEKGGTSVLADAYLVCGDLDESLFEFAFGFGFILQLIDDMQDAADDKKNDHMTIFSCDANKKKLDEKVYKLIALINEGIDFNKSANLSYSNDIRNLIVDNCVLMLFEAVSKNRQFFSKKFMRFARRYSALSLSFFKRTNRKIKRKMKPLMEKGII